MAEYERLLFAELSRIAESYRSDVDVAKSRENDLYNKVTQATSVSAAAGETQVELRELERTADAYRNLYQSFLSRFQEASQQQSFPVTEARVISRATVPKSPSYPKSRFLWRCFLFWVLVWEQVLAPFVSFVTGFPDRRPSRKCFTGVSRERSDRSRQ